MSLSFPTSKLADLKLLCRSSGAQGSLFLRAIAALLGKLNWAALAVRFAQAHYRNLQQLYNTAWRCTGVISTPWYGGRRKRVQIWIGGLPLLIHIIQDRFFSRSCLGSSFQTPHFWAWVRSATTQETGSFDSRGEPSAHQRAGGLSGAQGSSMSRVRLQGFLHWTSHG